MSLLNTEAGRRIVLLRAAEGLENSPGAYHFTSTHPSYLRPVDHSAGLNGTGQISVQEPCPARRQALSTKSLKYPVWRIAPQCRRLQC